MKTVTYHCDYCNNLIPENGEMIQFESDSGINVSNTFPLSKSCKLNNWKEFHFCSANCMKNKFLGIAIHANTAVPKTEKPSEKFTSYLFFINKEGNCISAIKKSDFESYSETIEWPSGYRLRNQIEFVSKEDLSLSKKFLLEENKYATIDEAAELISLMEKNEPGLKVHFANPK